MNRIKKLLESRNKALARINEIKNAAEKEERAYTESEVKEFESLEKEIVDIDTTIELEERTSKITALEAVSKESQPDQSVLEERAFADFIRGKTEEIRAGGEQNLDATNGGALLPTTIAKRIIKAVKDVSPIYRLATIYHTKGTLKIPVWGKANTTHDITVGYQTELTEITPDSGAFTSVDLGGYLVGALTLIGKSIINNSDIDVVSFVIGLMAEKIAEFIEGECISGSGESNSHATGVLTGATNVIETSSSSAFTADELIETQASVKQSYQTNAVWIMNNKTFTKVKKLKDSNGVYILQQDFSKPFPYSLLGKPVHVSDNMPEVAANAKVAIYGDLTGLSVNMRDNISIDILREKYSSQHAIGVNAWFEFDCKVSDNQKIAVLKMAASSSGSGGSGSGGSGSGGSGSGGSGSGGSGSGNPG